MSSRSDKVNLSLVLSVVLRAGLVVRTAAKGQQANGYSSFANGPCKVVPRMLIVQCGSESTSKSRSSGEMEVKSQERVQRGSQGRCHLTSNGPYFD